MGSRVTIRDVAAVAEVSPATVSRVLNADERVAPELRERVLAAVERLGYRPNSQARSLRTQATRVIGLIISDIQNPFFTSLVRGVEDAAQASGYSVVLANSDEDLGKEQQYLRVAAAEQMAGVILSPASSSRTRIGELVHEEIPVVTIDRRIAADVDSVAVDNVAGARQAVEHLLQTGARRVGVIAGPEDVSTAADRLEGYRAALRAAGLAVDPELIVRGDFRIDGGHRAAARLLDRPDRPDALFAANNLMLIGTLDAMAERGLTAPADLLLAGFDEMSWAGFAPPLTLVEQPTYEIGRLATQMLLRRIAGGTAAAEHVVLEATLKVRASSDLVRRAV
ncbi:LacI family DNA-binding transcriptional regulator [Catenulispora sp. NF23]|uniref:LacI family DNA-binding transcriptional regulator n=1 Tax=Catenulispora pinistramenti TaxID=2705254 RepID=A0ABS5KV86_9ACTN|nr:LacI family DNA-binding transcriptional regulator [Catenulispora pinistramenti]MBS2539500.1 LacI family DNA-binding transcriptional regulator [Catenulispora pinistramenti]MBS2549947.1 LacI family DNA-binding transcriptional regulator [Catenulispora pinistramenti]